MKESQRLKKASEKAGLRMEGIKMDERKLKNALKNYEIFLWRNCDREELIGLVLENAKKFYPVELIIMYFKKK